MATPIRVHEMLIAKLTPYFLLGLGSMALCVTVSVLLFDVPLRGSILVLILSTSVFLIAALGQGLLISTAARSQFVASQIALLTGFLPAFILSGFLFEINSMPLPIRILTYALPPRYFVSILQSLFAAGTIWSLILPDLAAMLAIGMLLMFITAKRSVKRLA
jgi:ABC-2 type transport system permease protein